MPPAAFPECTRSSVFENFQAMAFQAVAQFREGHEAVGKMFYPGLKRHPQYEVAQTLFKGASWLLSFELLDAEGMIEVINTLKRPIKATGLRDTRMLIMPVAPTIFFEAGAYTRTAMGISDGMLRLSAGIEDIDYLITNFSHALEFATQHSDSRFAGETSALPSLVLAARSPAFTHRLIAEYRTSDQPHPRSSPDAPQRLAGECRVAAASLPG